MCLVFLHFYLLYFSILVGHVFKQVSSTFSLLLEYIFWKRGPGMHDEDEGTRTGIRSTQGLDQVEECM